MPPEPEAPAPDGEASAREGLFWALAEELYSDPAVERSTMMGHPCLRFEGRFFASLERHTKELIVKLPADRVDAIVDDGEGVPFAPSGRVFREWVAVSEPDPAMWRALLAEAKAFADR